MHGLADCVKAINCMTGKDRTSPATLDLQRIVDATQAHIKTQPERLEHAAPPTDNPRGQQVPRVQTTADLPLTNTTVSRRIMHNKHLTTSSKDAQPRRDHQHNARPTHPPHEPGPRTKAAHSTPMTCGIHGQHNTTRTDTGSGGYGDSTNGAPNSKHTSKSTPVHFTTTIMLPRFCGGRNATTATSTGHGLTLTSHHTPREQSPPSIGSHGC